MSLDNEQFNLLMKNISANIPTNCGAYEDIRKKSQQATPLPGSTRFNISSYEAYRNDIEFTNSFIQQVLLDEANYFLTKYSKTVYDYLLEQRVSYRAQAAKDVTSALCGPLGSGGSGTGSEVPPNTCNNPDHIKLGDTLEEKNNFLQYLLKKTNALSSSPDVTYKKIEYRNESHDYIERMNSIITLCYFVLLVVLLLLLLITNRLELRQRFPLYLFLVLLPFLFPYLFEGLHSLYKWLVSNKNTSGPKNAFLETPDDHTA
jgi:hypothetical protein